MPIPLDGFQSTLPVGGATPEVTRAERITHISIHAPRGGSDEGGVKNSQHMYDFNPRSPWGERRVDILAADDSLMISIHAPRGGSDGSCPSFRAAIRNFNPRSPWGERPECCTFVSVEDVFQSTLPVGGATSVPSLSDGWIRISIHAPRGGSDMPRLCHAAQRHYFNPRSPWGERRKSSEKHPGGHYFNPRSPWGERPSCDPLGAGRGDFNPRSPWGERPSSCPMVNRMR